MTSSADKTFEIHPSSIGSLHLIADDPGVKKTLQSLRLWINSFDKRGVAVSNLLTDLSVPFTIASIIEQITGAELIKGDNLSAPTLKNYQFLMSLLVNYGESKLGIHQNIDKWTLQGILNRDISSFLYWIIELAIFFKCPYPIPSNVSIAVTCRENISGAVKTKTTVHKLTAGGSQNSINGSKTSIGISNLSLNSGLSEPSDSLDDLISTREQFDELQQLLLQYMNSKYKICGINLKSIQEVRTDQLLVLIGLIGGFFVPMKYWTLQPQNSDQNIKNAQTCIELLDKLEIPTDKLRAHGNS